MIISHMSTSFGNAAKNQFIINTNEKTIFKSYDSIIAKITWEDGERVVYIDPDFLGYSRTTDRYLGEFLGESIKTIREKVIQGVYKSADLSEELDGEV